MPLSAAEAEKRMHELKAQVAKVPPGSRKAVYDAVVQFLNAKIPHYNWVGIYEVSGEELVLESWRGLHATEHTRIPIGQGICGLAARTGATVNVPDVSKDPRYLQCFLSTSSELVVPIFQGGKVIGEIDIDADKVNSFNEHDEQFVEAAAVLVAQALAPVKAVKK